MPDESESESRTLKSTSGSYKMPSKFNETGRERECPHQSIDKGGLEAGSGTGIRKSLAK
jgi:hypothetical protein